MAAYIGFVYRKFVYRKIDQIWNCCAVLLVLDRLRILLFFRASVFAFLALGVGIFLAFKIGGRLIFGRNP